MGAGWLRRSVMLIRWLARAVGALTAALLVSIAAVVMTDEPLRLHLQSALLRQAGNPAAAEPFLKRALGMDEKALGAEHPVVAAELADLAGLYAGQGRYDEAEPLYKRLLNIREKTLAPEHPDIAAVLNSLGWTYKALARYAEAEPLYKRLLAVREKAVGPEHQDVAMVRSNLAGLYQAQGRYDEAEPLYKSSLAIFEKAVGPDHPYVANVLLSLAWLYQSQGGDNRQADPLNKRALAVAEKAFGPDHPLVAAALNNMALLNVSEGRYADAEPLYKRSLAIYEKAFGLEHPEVAQVLDNMGLLYMYRGRLAEAEAPLKRGLAIREKVFGPDHPLVADSFNDLGLLYKAQGRYAEAEPPLARNLAIDERTRGAEHPNTAMDLSNLAGLYLAQNDWARAAEYWRRSTAVVERRMARGLAAGPGLTGRAKSEVERFTAAFAGLVKVSHRLAPGEGSERAKVARDMFETAQWLQNSEAAQSLAQMAARGGADRPEVAAIARERQDLVSEWQQRDKVRVAALSQSSDKRDREAEAVNARRLAEVDARIGEIDSRLAKDFPNYAVLASPRPISVANVQALLHASEALVLFLDTPQWGPTPEETFIWVVTQNDSRWVRSDIGSKTLQVWVAALRCGLDEAAWSGDGAARCASLPGIASNGSPPRPLPFNLASAYELYEGLFGGVEDLIKDKHLLIVPSGALTSLPFQVLVTAAAADNDLASARWLIRDHALTVLPSVASLDALRRSAKISAAPEPFIGFGDPVLTRSCGTVIIPDKCPGDDVQIAAAKAGVVRSAGDLETAASFMRGGIADVAAVKSRLCPLPDTAFELKCVAKSLGAKEENVVLGKDMTEKAVKHMPLHLYRVVHFATHGLLAGETTQLAKDRAEPALVMSPPDVATEEDDGLLAASEVAGLKLDANWVVMSACNTASGGEPGAEALSGLAKAFFYSGARALLVSHWPVDSYAATMLTSRTFAEMRNEPSIGRSEAFRRAMLALMSDRDRPWAAHPSVWAPFVVVGEGAAQVAH